MILIKPSTTFFFAVYILSVFCVSTIVSAGEHLDRFNVSVLESLDRFEDQDPETLEGRFLGCFEDQEGPAQWYYGNIGAMSSFSALLAGNTFLDKKSSLFRKISDLKKSSDPKMKKTIKRCKRRLGVYNVLLVASAAVVINGAELIVLDTLNSSSDINKDPTFFPIVKTATWGFDEAQNSETYKEITDIILNFAEENNITKERIAENLNKLEKFIQTKFDEHTLNHNDSSFLNEEDEYIEGRPQKSVH